jgi:hypothetical protein
MLSFIRVKLVELVELAQVYQEVLLYILRVLGLFGRCLDLQHIMLIVFS